VLAIICFLFLSIGFYKGNDPSYEGLHYVIVYAHFAFGLLFFLYITLNFLSPLQQGLKVFKIAYKERNFPYASARLAGFVIILALFFYSDREVQKLAAGARFNYLGDLSAMQGDRNIAREYYKEGAVYAWDNHYSNYKLGKMSTLVEDYDEAIYRFDRATKRYPSPFAWVNLADVYSRVNEQSRVLGVLQKAQVNFPSAWALNNNLALAQADRGNVALALDLMREDPSVSVAINKWSMTADSSELESDYNKGDKVLQSNILSQLPLGYAVDYDPGNLLDTTSQENVIFLLNANWKIPDVTLDSITDRYLGQLAFNELTKNLMHSQSFNQFITGNINDAFRTMDQIALSVTRLEKGFYYNQMGLMALSIHAPLLALDFFDRSVEFRYDDSYFHRCIALLESSRWEMAKEAWSDLVQRDSSYWELYQLVDPILAGSNNESYAYAYYRVSEFSADSLIAQTSKFNRQEINQLWKKRITQDLKSWDLDEILLYSPDFEPYLDSANKAQLDLIMSSLKADLPFDRVNTNAFNLIKLIPAAKDTSRNIEDRYTLIQEAVEMNPYAPALIKEYCRLSLQMGLYDYGDFALVRLYELLPLSEYNAFERDYYEAKQKARSQLSWSQD
jgi:hypothetical protein